MSVDELLSRLDGVWSRGIYRSMARCPAHDDKNQSLSLAERDGKILLHCFAGCKTSAIVAALGITMKDLFTDITTNSHEPRKIARIFDYHDEAGTMLYQTVRYEPKGFHQRRPNGHGGWVWKHLEETRRVLYRLPHLLRETESLIVVHEGEKSVEAAIAAGLPGCHTTSVGGASNAKHTDFSPVKNRAVIVVPDNDSSGEQYCRDVAALATAAGALSVKVVRLQGLPPKGDIVEWIDAGGTAAAFTALLEQAELIEAAPIAVPVIYKRISDIEAKPIRWLWPGRIARGKVSMIAGNPGLGKSQVTASLAAIVTTGGQWPVVRSPCEPGNVVILSAEDDLSDTLRPRLEAAGANLDRCFSLEAVTDGGESRRHFNLQTDLARLGTMLEEIGGAALVVIDPITAYLGKVDSHKNAEVRAVLSPLAELAAQHETAVVCVSHFNKTANGEALMRVTGSLAFVAAARAAFVVTKDPENEVRRLFLPLKNNIGNDQTGLAFTIEPAHIKSPSGMIETSRVSWDGGVVTTTAQEAMRPQLEGDERSELEEAKDFLRELLADGPVSSKQVRADAEGAGHSWRTIRRAQSVLGMIATKEGMKGGWTWRLNRPSPAEDGQKTPKMSTSNGWTHSVSVGHLREQLEVEV